MRLRRRDAVWLTAAVLAHLSLLLVPLSDFQTAHRTMKTLSVSLLSAPRLATTDTAGAQPVTPPKERFSEPEDAPVSQPDPQRFTVIEHEPEPVVSEPTVTTARLLDAARLAKWSLPTPAEARRLGDPPPLEIPPNWKPGSEQEENLFDGMAVPEKTEIVDHWVAADGSRNIVMNTPGGQTVCGRVEAWNPMNPMIEPLMMFRNCGGGGRRTFKMPDRFNKHLVD